MIRTVQIERLALGLGKALANGNSGANDWQTLWPIPTPNVVDGYTPWGVGNTAQVVRLFIQPYADGPPGSIFSMRLWGWNYFSQGQADGARQLAVPMFIAEFLCTTGIIPGPAIEGPPGTATMRPVGPTENFCDTITLTQGDLGQSGWINATGLPANQNQSAVSTSLPAYILVELQGAQGFQFDFKQVDQISMNAAFCKA